MNTSQSSPAHKTGLAPTSGQSPEVLSGARHRGGFFRSGIGLRRFFLECIPAASRGVLHANKKVLAFGTFDHLHDGHRVFLAWARMQGETLTVAVAHDDAVLTLKGRKPLLGHSERCATLLKSGLADEVVVGDRVPGMWETLARVAPDIVVLGYDQNTLKNALENLKRERPFSFEVRICPLAHDPERLHSSKMRCG